MRGLILLALIAMVGCTTAPAPVDRPCGVIVDSLSDVRGATTADTRRIDRHFERGVGAGCWDRGGPFKTGGLF